MSREALAVICLRSGRSGRPIGHHRPQSTPPSSFSASINIQIFKYSNIQTRTRTARLRPAFALCHDLHRVGNPWMPSLSTAPLPLIPRRLAPLPFSPLMSTRRDPHPCWPVTIPDPSDSASTPVPCCSPSDPSKCSQGITQLSSIFAVGPPLIAVQVVQLAHFSTTCLWPTLSCHSST